MNMQITPPVKPAIFVRKRLLVADIKYAVSYRYFITEERLLERRRWPRIVLARQIGMYLARELTGRSFEYIGKHFGGRDHCTVRHAYYRVRARRASDPAFAAELEDFIRVLTGEL